MTRMAALIIAASAVILSTVSVAFADSFEIGSSSEHTEILRLAKQKVQAATQAGAVGNGAPLIGDAMNMLPWIGVATCAAAGTVAAAKVFKPTIQSV